MYDIAPEAIVEFYPARFDPYGVLRQPGGIFAYQFFDTKGGNCAYWLYDLNSVHVFETPRQWSLPKTELIDVGRYLHNPPVYDEPPPADFEDGLEAAIPGLDGCR